MLPELRAYERLSPELVLLAESHNPNVEGTLITDYLVTGARGYDWLLQIHRDAVIVDFEDMHSSLANMKSAVDELVEYPSIIRVLILVEGDKRTPMFVVTDLGAEGPEMVTKINALLEKKNKTMTDKRVITLNVPLDCKDPVGYVRDAVDTFMATHGEPGVDLDIRVNPNNDQMRALLKAEVPNINLVDAYPKPGEVDVKAQYPETYQLPNHVGSTLTIELEAGCENPEEVIGRLIDAYAENNPSVVPLIGGNKEQWIKRIMSSGLIEELNGQAGKIEYPVDALLAMDPVPARGQLKHFTAVDDAPFTEQSENTTLNIGDIDKAEVVAYDGVAEYTGFIRQWAEDRNIIGGGSTTLDQFIKGLNEAGELWTNISKGQHQMLKDDIGDVYVCLTNAAGCFDIKLEEHIRSLAAFSIHSGRQLYQRRGLKRYSLQVLYTLTSVAQAIENVLDSDNERDVEFFKSDFSEACADVVYVLETIALEQGWSMTECVAEAYNDIRDRKGLMLSGTFIKEKDFTDVMVKAAIADETTKPATREYLKEWLQKNVESCMQELSDQTQEHDAYLVKQEALKDAVKGMIGNIEGDELVVTLGLFGLPNRANEVFIIDPEKLNADIAKIVGTHIGEIGSPVCGSSTINAWLNRVTTVDVNNSAGVLKEAAVLDRGENQYGKILEVVGRVKPSDRASELLAANHSFGIRSVAAPTAPSSPKLAHVMDLVGFDLVIENPRPFGFVSILDKVK